MKKILIFIIAVLICAFIASACVSYSGSGRQTTGGGSVVQTVSSIQQNENSSSYDLDEFSVVFSETRMWQGSESKYFYCAFKLDGGIPNDLLIGYKIQIDGETEYYYTDTYYSNFYFENSDHSPYALFGQEFYSGMLLIYEFTESYETSLIITPFVAEVVPGSGYDPIDDSTFSVSHYYMGTSFSL